MDALSDALLVGGESGDDVEVVMAFIRCARCLGDLLHVMITLLLFLNLQITVELSIRESC